jgi:hypothetical protein
VLDALIGGRVGIGGQDRREEGVALLRERLAPGLRGEPRRTLDPPPARARRRLLAREQALDATAEVAVGGHHVSHHLVAAPLLGRGPLAEARRRHRRGGRLQVRHRLLHLLHDGRGRQLGPLRHQIPADPRLLLVHGG